MKDIEQIGLVSEEGPYDIKKLPICQSACDFVDFKKCCKKYKKGKRCKKCPKR